MAVALRTSAWSYGHRVADLSVELWPCSADILCVELWPLQCWQHNKHTQKEHADAQRGGRVFKQIRKCEFHPYWGNNNHTRFGCRNTHKLTLRHFDASNTCCCHESFVGLSISMSLTLEQIFESCDVDGSRTLDRDEIIPALQACGLFPEPEQLAREMQRKTDVTFEEFGAIQTAFEKPDACMQKPKTVPYACRGLELSHLRAITSSFLETDCEWFHKQCESYNAAHVA